MPWSNKPTNDTDKKKKKKVLKYYHHLQSKQISKHKPQNQMFKLNPKQKKNDMYDSKLDKIKSEISFNSHIYY